MKQKYLSINSLTSLCFHQLWRFFLQISTISHCFSEVGAFIRETDAAKKAAIKKEILTEVVPYYFSRFEKELKAGNGYFGGKVNFKVIA